MTGSAGSHAGDPNPHRGFPRMRGSRLGAIMAAGGLAELGRNPDHDDMIHSMPVRMSDVMQAMVLTEPGKLEPRTIEASAALEGYAADAGRRRDPGLRRSAIPSS
jgi:hypothetical protein